MSAAKWHEADIHGFDTETTGINVHSDRIITAALVHTAPGRRPTSVQWILNPGIDIPDEAAAVHGWSTERLNATVPVGQALRIDPARQTPMAIDGALGEIAGRLATLMAIESPIVAANAAYDFSILENELARNGVDTITSRPTGVRGVVDPMVIEKQWDPYRRLYKDAGGCRGGKHKCGGCGAENKTLTGLALHYGLVVAGAHDAGADALAAVRVAKKLMDLWPEAARWKLDTLHTKQQAWRWDHMKDLRAYFNKNGIEHDGCCGEWPMHVRCAPAAAGAVA